MPQPSKPQLAIYAALAVAVLLIGARFLRAGDGAGVTGGGGAVSVGVAGRSGGGAPGSSGAGAGSSTSASPAEAAPAASAGGPLVVDVKGAVHRPGVYHLPAGARALDAVRRAGGLAHRADRVGVNLAARVVDGGEVVVPVRGAAAGAEAGGSTASAAAAGASGGKGAGAAPLALDLNTATAEQLQQLDGVGPATAAKIVAYRTAHGGIRSIDELDEVSGIGPAKLAAIRTQLGR